MVMGGESEHGVNLRDRWQRSASIYHFSLLFALTSDCQIARCRDKEVYLMAFGGLGLVRAARKWRLLWCGLQLLYTSNLRIHAIVI